MPPFLGDQTIMKETFLSNYISEILKSSNYHEIPDFMKHRLHYAYDQLQEKKSLKRTIDSPTYLNDLGVRKAKSPEIGFEILKKICNIKFLTFDQLNTDINTINEEFLDIYLDSYILISGDFPNIYKALKLIEHKLIKIKNYKTLIFIASAYAAELDDKSIIFFNLAYENTTDDEKKVVAIHRKAAFLIKRTQKHNDTLLVLQQLVSLIEKISISWKRQIYMALANNLYALELVHSGLNDLNKSSIIYFLLNAKCLIDSLPAFKGYDKSNELIDEAMRYRSQVEMNYAQILIDNKQISESVEVLKSNLKYVSINSKDYLPEAESTLGYAYYLNKDYVSSIDILEKSLKHYKKIGALYEENEVTQNLIAALYKNGNIDASKKLFINSKKSRFLS